MTEHEFTPTIHEILVRHFGENSHTVFEKSLLLQYLNEKTRSASRGAKSRSAYANHYVLYVLLEDYIRRGFLDTTNNYEKAEGAKFSDLLKRARELPFGAKLQNHAFNSRLNDEFKKYFPTCPLQPVRRDYETKRYWINENFLKIRLGRSVCNIAPAILEIIDAYVEAKENSFHEFVDACRAMQCVSRTNPNEIRKFIVSLLHPNVDARLFEIVSYAVLKRHYSGIPLFWGWTRTGIIEEPLKLFKTGRTNANDGGIDFVMKPLGRFFQVTETTDVKKYFLDIDKVQRYPITFVVKTDKCEDILRKEIEEKAKKEFPVERIIEKYMNCIEEIINIPRLLDYLAESVKKGDVVEIFQEIILQSEVEFNFPIKK